MATISEYQNLIKPIMIINKILSIWPLEKENVTTLDIWLRTVHRTMVFLIVGTYTIGVTADFLRHLGDNIGEVTECALIGTAFYLSILRLIIYTIHQEKLTYIIKTMKNDWENSDIVDQEILKDKCLDVFKLSKYFIVTVVVTVLTFMSVPLLETILLGSEKRILPFRGYFLKNQTNYPTYGYLYMYSVLSGGLSGCTISGVTSLNLVIVMHGSAKFKLVREKLETLKNHPDDVQDFADCVKLHQSALYYAEVVENAINILALGQFLISSGLLCFAGLQITSGTQEKGTIMKYTSFLNSAIFELFLFSFSGNELITESEDVGVSSYSSDWIGTEYSKVMRLIMMRSLIPSTITAGKFYSMSLMSFSSVLSTAFSYFTVLRTMRTE